MDETTYLRLVGAAFKRVEDALESVDTNDVDVDSSGDVLTLHLRNGVRCIINTQRPTRQIWLAARANAWHFSYDEPSARWLHDKGTGDELFGVLSAVLREHAGVDVTF